MLTRFHNQFVYLGLTCKLTQLSSSQGTPPLDNSSSEPNINPACPVPTASKTPVEANSKGTFTTQSYNLKKIKKVHKIGCRMCDTVCNSNKELSCHHQQTHNILYCEVCSKAFNNPSSLAKYQYSHKELRFKCADCDQEFAFESNLKTHCISHRTLATHFCVHPNCSKHFKNKGDLTIHVKEHDGVLHECPDCSYKNPDVRNLESHRL